MAINIPTSSYVLQYAPKFTQIGIFWFENIPFGNPVVARVKAAYCKQREAKTRFS
jgi:hypothetical protein